MLIKKKDPRRVKSLYVNSRRSKKRFIIATIIAGIIFLMGAFASLVITGYFGSISNPNPIIGDTAIKLGVLDEAKRGSDFLKNSLHPINYIKGKFSNPEKIYIDISFKDYAKIAQKREEAIKRGILYTTEEDEVPATIRYNNEEIKINIRLKGILSDHWSDKKKWSFRVNVKGDKTIFGMKKFSLQQPKTRSYLNEWYLHKFVSFSGLLAVRYDFIQVYVNGNNLGIYAIEEHFEKRLVENNKLREGPIIAFDHNITKEKEEIIGHEEMYLTSPIKAFVESKTLGDERLSNQFYKAKDLLESFRRKELKTREVFDVEKTAKLFAISDLFGYHHMLKYTNIQFYYNPVTSKLEPIAFDNQFIKDVSEEGRYMGLVGEGRDSRVNEEEFDWLNTFFEDEIFFEEYISALNEMSNKSMLDEFFVETKEEEEKKLNTIHKSYAWYSFDYKKTLYQNQEYIQNMLNNIPAVLAYHAGTNKNDNEITINIGNIHPFPIEVLSVENDGKIFKPDRRLIFNGKRSLEKVDYHKEKFISNNGVNTQKNVWEIEYKLIGVDTIRKEKIISWDYIDEENFNNDAFRKEVNLEIFDFLKLDKKTKDIFVKKGIWIVNKDIIIPEDYTLTLGEGTMLDFREDAKIISYGNILFIGSEEKPIKIISSDGSGQGIVIIGANRESTIIHTEFKNLGEISYNGWSLPGAITFYESNINISHALFREIRAEDALGIMRSSYSIEKTVFENARGDCFDSDFSTGIIKYVSFINCGNDGLDVSGSVVTLNQVAIKKAGDKGISIGEMSVATIEEIGIKEAYVGIASKDKSKVKVKGDSDIEAEYPLVVYQKKSEFGPSNLEVTKDVKIKNNENNLIEIGSSLIIGNEIIKTNSKDVYAILYGKE